MSKLIDTFANRLKYALMVKDIKPIELSKKTGISKTNISCYMSGKYEAKQDGVKILADALDINPVWLMGYDVSMDKNIKTDELGNPVVSIPLLGTVKAGYNYLAEENWIGSVDINKQLADTGDFFALKIHGDSMFPVLIEDDIVIVKKQDDFDNGDIVVALINGNEATVKKAKRNNNSILLQPLNTTYEPLIFTNDEIKSIPVKIIGIVKQLKRDF